MIATNDKLMRLARKSENGSIKILITGLGSVGNYLLSYLLSMNDPALEIVVVGRDARKMQVDANIAQVASLIRRQNKSHVKVVGGVDLDDIDSIISCLKEETPDFIINTSRAFAGLKYGSISWTNVRAYGIWTPLSVRYIRNIMEAHERVGCKAIVINTSYSDATIPWIKSAGREYPDFGSGNLNHLVPRVKLAAAQLLNVDDFWNIEVDLATAHFHDVVISKEGHAEGATQLLRLSYRGDSIDLDQDQVLSLCSIPMPSDAKRNMMNASSNFDIIQCILTALREHRIEKFFSPGALGELGGYPVIVDGMNCEAGIDVSVFSLADMRRKNQESMYLDGIERIESGSLFYTDELLEKVEKAFSVRLPKEVRFEEVDTVADMIVEKVILPALNR